MNAWPVPLSPIGPPSPKRCSIASVVVVIDSIPIQLGASCAAAIAIGRWWGAAVGCVGRSSPTPLQASSTQELTPTWRRQFQAQQLLDQLSNGRHETLAANSIR